MTSYNSYVGLKYNRTSFNVDKDIGVNCIGLIKDIDKDFSKFIDNLTNETNTAKILNGNRNLFKTYNKVDFEQRSKNDIILIKDKKEKAYTHIGILVDKNNYLHAVDIKFGSIIQHISFLKFTNKDFILLRKKEEVKNEN